jgi:hypothetical protein
LLAIAIPQMKIQIVNSPFDFDEVGQKTAQRWLGSGYADLTADGYLQIRTRSALSIQRAIREDERFDHAVDSGRGGSVVGEWATKHSGPRPMPGGPEFGVKQFIATIA